jgi:endonuclease III
MNIKQERILKNFIHRVDLLGWRRNKSKMKAVVELILLRTTNDETNADWQHALAVANETNDLLQNRIEELEHELLIKNVSLGEPKLTLIRALMESEEALQSIDDVLDEIDKINGDAPHRAIGRCERIKVLAGLKPEQERKEL